MDCVEKLLAEKSERLNYLEKLLDDSADKHAQEIAALTAANTARIAEFTISIYIYMFFLCTITKLDQIPTDNIPPQRAYSCFHDLAA